MKFYSRRRASPVITIVSLIDILTILLIFFIVTTTFKSAQPQVQIVLPAMKSGEASKINKSKPAILAITAAGDVSLDDKPMTDEEVGPAIKHIQEAGRPTAMKVDEGAPVKRMFEVLDALKIANVSDMPMLTREKNKK